MNAWNSLNQAAAVEHTLVVRNHEPDVCAAFLVPEAAFAEPALMEGDQAEGSATPSVCSTEDEARVDPRVPAAPSYCRAPARSCEASFCGRPSAPQNGYRADLLSAFKQHRVARWVASPSGVKLLVATSNIRQGKHRLLLVDVMPSSRQETLRRSSMLSSVPVPT